jgi:hypothetical protein
MYYNAGVVGSSKIKFVEMAPVLFEGVYMYHRYHNIVTLKEACWKKGEFFQLISYMYLHMNVCICYKNQGVL